MKNVSLRKKLGFAIGAISLAGLAAVMVVAARTAQVVAMDEGNAVKSAARLVMSAVDHAAEERVRELKLFAASDAARSVDPVRLVPYLNELVATFGATYPAMMVLNRHGRVVAVNTVDSRGKATRSDGYLGRDYSQAAWFRRAVAFCHGPAGDGEAGMTMTSDCVIIQDIHNEDEVTRDFNSSGKLLSLSTPIRNPRTGEILGVWVNQVNWQSGFGPIFGQQADLLHGGWLPKVALTLRDAQGKNLYTWDGEGTERSPTEASAPREALAHPDTLSGVSESQGFGGGASLGWSVFVEAPYSDAIHRFNLGMSLLAVLLVAVGATLGWKSLGGTVDAFHNAMHHLDDQSDHLRSASGQLTGASQELAQSATEQASSLQQTASAIDEINSMINRSAENAERSIRIAESSQETATRGKQVVDTMIRAIGDISESNGSILKQIEAGNQQLTEIIKVISEIGNKTKVINDIAFQTKLLSFNASVEAARAGEHGKGFAVVAEEVGSLAQMSGNAARDIGDMLTGSISTVQEIVDSSRGRVERLIEEGKSKINMGIQVARQCEKVLEEIVRAESQMNSIINEIASASRDQAQGMGEITRAVGQLDQVTNRNANIAQQTEEFAHAISALASTLKAEVGSFRTFLDGQSRQLAAATKASGFPTEGTGTRTGSRQEPSGSGGEGSASSGGDNWPNNVIPLRPQSGVGESSSPLDAFLSSSPTGNAAPGIGGGNVDPSGTLDQTPSETDHRFKEV
jgi:methyl-accepting chemotaxis protein